MIHVIQIFPTGYNFPRLASPTDKHLHTFLFAVLEYFWLVNTSTDLKCWELDLQTIFDKILLRYKEN